MLIVALVLTSGINQDFIVVRAVVDNFIILLEFLVIIWNDPNYLLDLFGLSAFQFLVIKSLSFFLWITRHEVPALYLVFVIIRLCPAFLKCNFVLEKYVRNGNPGAIGSNGDTV